MRDIFVHPAGQDDNLGDSALRVGLLQALRGEAMRLHVHLDGQSSDYLAGVPLRKGELYPVRRDWISASQKVQRPVFVINAGEINPRPGVSFPNAQQASELSSAVRRGGTVVATGIGLKDPSVAGEVNFVHVLREAAIVSWRDHGSRDAAGFGDVAPDWAFALGSPTSDWMPRDARRFIAVTLRFDRPWPDDQWFVGLRELAAQTGATLVTVAQVARDQPRAVQLADVLGCDYIVAASTRHDDLDKLVRSVYSGAVAVVSDRAHALIMGATEGAYPIGSAADPGKIRRLLDTAGIGMLTGHYNDLTQHAAHLEEAYTHLPVAIRNARQELSALTARIHSVTSIGESLPDGKESAS